MDADESRPQIRRARPVERVALPDGPARDLREAIYRLYAEADFPRLDDLVRAIAEDDDLPGSPKKDLISAIISGAGPASRQDTVTVAVALARAAGRGDADQVMQQVRQWWVAARTAPPPPPSARLGRPVAECDPIVLEVHPAIHTSSEQGGRLARLPAYVSREHDARLREVADQLLAGGPSRLVTLVGGSSTGKTRACWELARYLERQDPGRWRVWHPYDPTRPEAALTDLGQVSEYTIVWLNETQSYLQPPDTRLGERIAAGLRTLMQDSDRGPVLVLATLWPQHWDALTAGPDTGKPDKFLQARNLLTGSRIDVADRFTPDELTSTQAAGVDARLRQAAAQAEGGRITQYLAGASELEDRYRTALPAAKAIIQIAVDARRFGYPPALPHALLEQAVPGYLDDLDWDHLDDDWLEQALAYTGRPCKGARGPLTRIRPRPHQPSPAGGQPCYRLADYLEQIGRTERAGVYPPESLWRAFTATVTDPALLVNLGWQARYRGRYQHAIWLFTQAAAHGDTDALDALYALAMLREQAGDHASAQALYQEASDRGNPDRPWALVWLREQVGDHASAEALAGQAADHGDALRALAVLREQAGDAAGAEALYRQAVDRGNTDALRYLARLREQAGDHASAEVLARQAADYGDTQALHVLAMLREQAGDHASAEALYRQAAVPANPDTLRSLARLRDQAGDAAGAEALYRQAVDRGDIDALWELAERRELAGDNAGADRMRRFGLNGSGETATRLDFGA